MRQEVANERPQASFVVTRTIPRTKLAKEVYEALLGHGLAVLPTPMVQRQVYPQTAAEGRTVFDTQNREAITEARAVAAELLEFLEVPHDA